MCCKVSCEVLQAVWVITETTFAFFDPLKKKIGKTKTFPTIPKYSQYIFAFMFSNTRTIFYLIMIS